MSANLNRREFLTGAAAVGGTIAAMPLLGGGLKKAFADPFAASGEAHGTGALGEEIPADRIIYTTCEQCQTFCTIKVALTESGRVRKIAGNPYSPLSSVPFGQIPYNTDPAEAARGLGDLPEEGRSLRGGRTCLKGQAGIQTAYDAYRIARPLKRVGPRGSGEWATVSWEQAVTEIAAAIKPVLNFVPQAVVMSDWEKVKKGELTKAAFSAKYQDVLIDTSHRDLGPKSNQIAMLTGNRIGFVERWIKSCAGSVNVFNHGGICGASGVTANVRTRNGKQLKKRQYADLDFCEYLIVWGTNPMTANKGPTWLAPRLTNALERGMKMVVVDPRLSKTAEKAHLWVPVKPGQDAALALAMIRWIIEHKRYDLRYLTNPNQKAALADGEPTWSDATHLVNVATKAKVKGKDVGLSGAAADQFVVLGPDGRPAAAEAAGEGALEVDTEVGAGLRVKSAFTLLKERAFEKSLQEYAELCGVSDATIVEMAREFTAHGKRAVAISYRGPAMHTNGFYAVQAIGILNFLIGNHDWKGGENSSAVRYTETKGKRYDLEAVPKGRAAWGLPITREKGNYAGSTLFQRDGYPAKRTWVPFGASLTSEVIPSAYDGYPYPLKALFINRLSPVESVAGGQFQGQMLKDEQRLPLIVAFDVVIGATSQYADYILPDVTYLERWNLESIYPNQNLKESHMTQPVVNVLDGARMVEDVLIDLGKQMGLPGVGDGAFADGSGLHAAHDYYLKVAANVAFDETPVPDASADEERLFLAARRLGLGARFAEAKWRAALKPEEWLKAVYVLNRGGRFAPADTGYEGEWLKMRHGGQVNFYDEGVAKAKSSYDGTPFDGVPRIEPVRDYRGRAVADDLPLQFINWKSSHLGTHRTIGDAWLREIRSSNPVWMNPRDAAARGLTNGDRVRVRSASFTAETEVHLTEGIRPGVVGADFSYGHEAYGARPVKIDGRVIPAAPGYGHTPYSFRETGTEPTGYAPGRGTGFRVNDLACQDETLGKGSPLIDPIGGSCSQLDTRVEVEKA
ncbi:MAG TPA: molybdopterin-dependent oxidoreductase [Symbiobacteriaceae bacterium]|nr:molybdopterin-dependent oxidoreductase [Symbiobacteriaceae bacterium]